MEQQGKKGLAIAGLVCGIASCVCCWAGYGAIAGIVIAIVGLVLSILAQKSYKAIGQKNKMATIGLILSIVGLVLSVIMLIACVICAGLVAATGEAINNGEIDLSGLESALSELESIAG